MTLSPTKAALPIVGTITGTLGEAFTVGRLNGYVARKGDALALHADALTAIAEQAGEVRMLREALEACRDWHQGDKWRDAKNDEQRGAWETHFRRIDAALEKSA